MNAMTNLHRFLAAASMFLLLSLPFTPVYAQTADAAGASTEAASTDSTPAPADTGDASTPTDQGASDPGTATPPVSDDSQSAADDSGPTQTTVGGDELQSTDSSGVSSDTGDTQDTIPGDTLVDTEDPSQVPADGDGSDSGGVPVDPGSGDTGGDSGSGGVPVDPGSGGDTGGVPVDPGTGDDGGGSVPIPTDPVPDPITSTSTPTSTTPIDTPPDTGTSTPDTPQVPLQPPPVVADLPMKDINPKKTYTFAIQHRTIATVARPAWQAGAAHAFAPAKGPKGQGMASTTDDPVTYAPSVSVDQKLDAPTVSGACSSTYYVILLYKNETDYNTDPASYIVNKAFPCVGGRYHFVMRDLPTTLPSGTYYLLVGSMGDTGSWTPITALVPISVNRQ